MRIKYSNNIKIMLVKSKQYYKGNAGKIKRYQIDNARKIKQYKNQKTMSECGDEYSTTNTSRHLQSTRHLKYIENKNRCINGT